MNATKWLALLASFYTPLALSCVPSESAAAPKPATPKPAAPAPATLEPAERAVPVIPARPEDVGSIDGIMQAFYEVVNVSPEEPRQWSRDRTLYVPHIRFVGVGKHVVVYDHESLVAATEPMVARGFHERELGRVVRRYGNVAHVLSSYETRETKVAPDGKNTEETRRGVNSLDLYFDGTRWWIASVLWQTESPALPIPPDLLP